MPKYGGLPVERLEGGLLVCGRVWPVYSNSDRSALATELYRRTRDIDATASALGYAVGVRVTSATRRKTRGKRWVWHDMIAALVEGRHPSGRHQITSCWWSPDGDPDYMTKQTVESARDEIARRLDYDTWQAARTSSELREVVNE